jgi:hypothetical protein
MAEPALADLVRVRGLGVRAGKFSVPILELGSDSRPVGGEVVRRERRGRPVAEHQVHSRGTPALEALELVRVEEQLEDVARLRVAPELRVVDLVGPRPKVGRLVDANQEVRVPEPPIAGEAALMQDLAAFAHPCDRALRALLHGGSLVLERYDVAPLGDEPSNDGVFVAVASLE